MSYSVRVFKNTGFNAVNVPDSPALLNTCTYSDLDSVDILQDGFMPYVDVRTSWSDIKSVDYALIGDWYYSVERIQMTSVDVARLFLLPDFLLSAGGVSFLTAEHILDGITERVCLDPDDLYTAATGFNLMIEPDEYMNPAYQYDLHTEIIKDSDTGTQTTMVESTIDLWNGASGADAVTYTDSNSGQTVTVPTMGVVQTPTQHNYGGARGTRTYEIDSSVQGNTIKRGIARARALGLESAIVAQYSVPTVFIDGTNTLKDTDGGYNTLAGYTMSPRVSSLNWRYGGVATVYNPILFMSHFTKYGILTAAGNRGEYEPTVIYQRDQNFPVLIYCADLRSGGRPYWRFQYLFGDATRNGFWNGCLAGEEWQNVPLVYTGRSGNALDQQMFDARRDAEHTSYKWARGMNAVDTAVRAIPPALRAVSQFKTGFSEGMGIGTVMTANPAAGVGMGLAFGLADAGASAGEAIAYVAQGVLNDAQIKAKYKAATLTELTQYVATTKVAPPELAFPYVSSIVRDAIGNGVLAYRYQYKDADIRRIDKILTMYGNKYTAPLLPTHFTNRRYFNYVQAAGATIGGLPRWWCDGIAAQLTAGARYWHVLPDVTHYTDGNR